MSYAKKFGIWAAAVATFVIIAQVAKAWMPEVYAQALGFAAMGFMMKPILEPPDKRIPLARWAIGVGVGTAVAIVIWLLMDLVIQT